MKTYKYAFSYICCVAWSSVIREVLMLEVSPMSILFLSSILTCIYFHNVNRKTLRELYQKFWQHKLFLLQLNLIIACMWLATYYSIYFSSATLFVYEFFIVGGALSIALSKDNFKLVGLVLFTGLIIAPFYYYSNFLGIVLGICAGVFGFIYNVTSHKIACCLELSATQTLTVRFWFLMILSFCMMPVGFIQQFTFNSFLSILLITFLSFILQTWLNQKSIIILGGKESALVTSLSPSLTFFIQGIIFNRWYIPLLLLSLLGSIFIVITLLLKEKRESALLNFPWN